MKLAPSRSLAVNLCVLAGAAAVLAACAGNMSSPASSSGASGMTFFVSSTGSGRGGDLGGLAGADRLCTSLASAVGAGNHTWRAYLSTQSGAGGSGVNARDRIGTGPWRNAKGVVDREQRDRAARQQQHQQGDCADGEGRDREGQR